VDLVPELERSSAKELSGVSSQAEIEIVVAEVVENNE
jgi:hypothetical protein